MTIFKKHFIRLFYHINMSSTAGLWRFNFRNVSMKEDDLKSYQHKLLEIREKYRKRVDNVTGCGFYEGVLPPKDNIFASFKFECKRHHPPCSGWYLIWNPNLDTNNSKLNGSLHNHCTLWQYKSVSKKIQLELVHDFGRYFDMFDDDDTHPYFIDQFYNLKYGFKTDEDEVPDYTSFDLDEAHLNVADATNEALNYCFGESSESRVGADLNRLIIKKLFEIETPEAPAIQNNFQSFLFQFLSRIFLKINIKSIRTHSNQLKLTRLVLTKFYLLMTYNLPSLLIGYFFSNF
ncbi:hypothetical protein BpHYR1_019261 [Brachionus plicatilis]|uniref:Uncharacterized protein n=1 Tax=Brachionus plicatilis TaxID=10195 RepID=A0A3M7PEH7_BRAPC|nr:hypothetical protein BpHYR1_019261 [Brachionus plicatilis]